MIPLRALLIAATLLVVPSAAPAQVPGPLRSAEAMASRIEAAERDPLLAMELDADLSLDAVDAELEAVLAYLSSSPEDPTALLLTVRLGRIRDLLAFRDAVTAMFTDPAATQPETPSLAPHLKVLDQLLERDPRLAAAHYWKARLTMEEVTRQAGWTAEVAPAPGKDAETWPIVLHHARSAVELAPDSVAHRELFAGILADDDDFDEAVRVLAHPSTAGGLMHLLVEDLLTFAPPPPAGTDEVLGSFALMTAMMGAGDSEDADLARYVELRARGWSTTAPETSLKQHYQDRWPGLRFLSDNDWDGASAAHFAASDSGWRAVRDDAEVEALERGGASGIILIVLPVQAYAEMRAAALAQGMPKDAVPRGDRVGLLLINGRR